MSKPTHIKPRVAALYHLCIKRYSAIEMIGIALGTTMLASRPGIVGLFGWAACIGMALALNMILGAMVREAIEGKQDGNR